MQPSEVASLPGRLRASRASDRMFLTAADAALHPVAAVPGPIAGTSAFSPPCPNSWIWENDAGHLLDAYRSGFSVSALSHPAAGETARRRSEGEVAMLTRQILLIRHHSLYTPRDFAIPPYFAIIKTTLETGFDYKRFSWERSGLSQHWA